MNVSYELTEADFRRLDRSRPNFTESVQADSLLQPFDDVRRCCHRCHETPQRYVANSSGSVNAECICQR